MKIGVISNNEQKDELTAGGIDAGAEITWQKQISEVAGAEAYIDLLFDPSRFEQLSQLSSSIIIVNAVENTLEELPGNFIRINGWNSFLRSGIIEASSPVHLRSSTEKIFSSFNKKIEWLADIKGFFTARVVSMIINEAYFALEEKVSSKEEIDIAMKTGTNYPYGPFEWSRKIGLKKIYSLLKKLSAENSRYAPSALLEIEALVPNPS